jgi:hypothetical protein
MAYYEGEVVRQLYRELINTRRLKLELMLRFMQRRYRSDDGEMYAQQGFCRRFATLQFCIEEVFRLLPPEQERIPEDNAIQLAAIHLQTFLINVFGCVDNLAWTWVAETNLVGANGQQINRKAVGLRAQNAAVRNSFPQDFRDYLQTRDDWLSIVTEVRDALAHRVPLYIPPHFVQPVNAAAYRDLEQRFFAARFANNDAEADRLQAEQETLMEYRPIFVHSGDRGMQLAPIHPQILNDFITVHEMASGLVALLPA